MNLTKYIYFNIIYIAKAKQVLSLAEANKMKKLIFFVIFYSMANLSFAQTDEKYSDLFCELSKKNVKSYIFGSINEMNLIYVGAECVQNRKAEASTKIMLKVETPHQENWSDLYILSDGLSLVNLYSKKDIRKYCRWWGFGTNRLKKKYVKKIIKVLENQN